MAGVDGDHVDLAERRVVDVAVDLRPAEPGQLARRPRGPGTRSGRTRARPAAPARLRRPAALVGVPGERPVVDLQPRRRRPGRPKGRTARDRGASTGSGRRSWCSDALPGRPSARGWRRPSAGRRPGPRAAASPPPSPAHRVERGAEHVDGGILVPRSRRREHPRGDALDVGPSPGGRGPGWRMEPRYRWVPSPPDGRRRRAPPRSDVRARPADRARRPRAAGRRVPRHRGELCELDHRDAFELLAATILSAQSTDVRVNMVTPAPLRPVPDAVRSRRRRPPRSRR